MIAACTALGILALLLLFALLRGRHRIRRLTQAMEAFTSHGGEPFTAALAEDDLAALENTVSQLQEALLQAKRLYQEERDRGSQLTADISHQLKTPLTTLRLYTELDAPPHMSAALEQITRMEHLIQSLLRLERLCAGGYRFTFGERDIAPLIWEQWRSLSPIYPDRKLEITGGARIRCDEKWLGEAFCNLLKNACEHTAPGGRITVSLEQTEAAFFCAIADDGGGVPEAELPRLFQRFYRAEGQKSQGAGIGLSIVKEIIRRHHGSITAENTENGLKMTIAMPIFDTNLAKF